MEIEQTLTKKEEGEKKAKPKASVMEEKIAELKKLVKGE
jgi:hypothetical protein